MGVRKVVLLSIGAAFVLVVPTAAATIAVTTTAESPGGAGDCTLGEAINAANTDAPVDACAGGSGADVIRLPRGAYTYTLRNGNSRPNGGAFLVSSDITITGPGSTLTFEPGRNTRFFEVITGAILTLEGLTLLDGAGHGAGGVGFQNPGPPPTPGQPGRGGAIHNTGWVTLRDVLLKKNKAFGGQGGFGAWFEGGPPGADGGPGQGGAIYNAGALWLERCTFSWNEATGGAGGTSVAGAPGAGGAGEGGAIYSAPGSLLEMTDTHFLLNRARGGAGGSAGETNVAAGVPGPASGGGVASRGTLSLTRVSLRWNQAIGGIANTPADAHGGGIAVLGGGLSGTVVAVADNNATGGRYTYATGIGPTGAASGGGLYVNGATATLTRASFADNTAHGGPLPPGGSGTIGLAHGGGVAAAGGTLALGNITLTANSAADGGGGVHLDAASTLTIHYGTVVQNSSASAAGGVVAAGAATLTTTIVALNGGGNCQGAVADGGSNLQYADGSCPGIPVTDPMVAPRRERGGTVYHPLLPGSPARDATAEPCPAEDQLGAARPADGDGNGTAACDIGAIEADAPPAPDLIFEDGFETGDLSAWSGAATDGGDLVVTAEAARASAFGLRAVVTEPAPLYVVDQTPNDERRYRARFYFDPREFDPGPPNGTFRSRIFIGFDASPQRRLFAVVLRKSFGAYSLMVRTRLDDNTQVDTEFAPIAAAVQSVEIDWRRASTADANDGSLQLWIDGGLIAQRTGLDNASGGIDFVRLGALSVKQGSSGHLDFDWFASRRQNYIGP
jgi:CSLREA domain-containing protein